ncbi:hypothetical protein [Vibrio spartinae]|uniref:ABM domain-containing protein n=1 Tax=Vibrio spartinae TaxID=1918945 RepID=A0A1N6M6U6_9VIBR|nr:hypothetical protein [Vibrio spartinae]QMV13917.1 hypothetical protein Vspart_01164 [Vibrio spartinae]SIO95181.1 hypothetical protein VSP9026_02922 [Vibrio spartinae]
MTSQQPLNIIASLEISRDKEHQFRELAKCIFPPLANQTGWTLTSVWFISEEQCPTLKIQNQWNTAALTIEQLNSELESAFEQLIRKSPEYQNLLDELDALTLEETLSYAYSYTL